MNCAASVTLGSSLPFAAPTSKVGSWPGASGSGPLNSAVAMSASCASPTFVPNAVKGSFSRTLHSASVGGAYRAMVEFGLRVGFDCVRRERVQ